MIEGGQIVPNRDQRVYANLGGQALAADRRVLEAHSRKSPPGLISSPRRGAFTAQPGALAPGEQSGGERQPDVADGFGAGSTHGPDV